MVSTPAVSFLQVVWCGVQPSVGHCKVTLHNFSYYRTCITTLCILCVIYHYKTVIEHTDCTNQQVFFTIGKRAVINIELHAPPLLDSENFYFLFDICQLRSVKRD